MLEPRSEAPSASIYHNLVGRVTRSQLVAARQEFERRFEQGEHDVRVLLAQNVRRASWENAKIDVRGYRVVLKSKTDYLLVDIELLDVSSILNAPYRTMAMMVNCQLTTIARHLPHQYLFVATGDVTFQRANRVFETRYPDGAVNVSPRFCQRYFLPRLIIEVMGDNHSLAAAQVYCREYFEGSEDIRAVLLLKCFSPIEQNEPAAIVGILYRRNGNDVDVADVVSFGNMHLDSTEVEHLEQIDPAYRVQGQVIRDMSRTANVDAEICISGEDVYFEAPADVPRQDLAIQLSSLFQSYTEDVKFQRLRLAAIRQHHHEQPGGNS